MRESIKNKRRFLQVSFVYKDTYEDGNDMVVEIDLPIFRRGTSILNCRLKVEIAAVNYPKENIMQTVVGRLTIYAR